MTRGEALREGAGRVAPVSGTPALDAALILACVLGLSREGLLASRGETLEESDLARFREGIGRRASGSPVAYLIGRKEFWSRDFEVCPAVLVPRPDTELLVELALERGDAAEATLGRPLRAHECCVGSGAVAVSLAAERPAWQVSASDLSPAALEVARGNVARLLPTSRPGGALGTALSDLLSSVAAPEGGFDLIIANPPYVESPLAAELAAAWGEPLLALDGGPDGLDLVRRLVPEAVPRLARGGWLLLEADPAQARAARDLFAAAGLEGVETRRDLGGLERVTLGRRP